MAILVASSWGLLRAQWGYTHDYLHANRFAEYARGLAAGDWPVIWSQNFSYGYGMPMFEFYAPLPSLVGAVLYLLGLEPILITRILFLIANLLSLIGAYLLGKKLFHSKLAGLTVSALFTLAPYRAVDLFVRGAISESWAIMSLPWILYGTILILEQPKVPMSKSSATQEKLLIKTSSEKIIQQKNYLLDQNYSRMQWLVLPLSLLVLMLSHNLSVIMAVPFCLLFAVIYYFYAYFWQKRTKGEGKGENLNSSINGEKKGENLNLLKKREEQEKNLNSSSRISGNSSFLTWWQALWRIILAYVGGILLASFYLWPAFFEKSLTQVNTQVINSYFDFRIHFLSIIQWLRVNWGWGGSVFGPDDGMSFFLGFNFLLLIFLMIFLLAYYLAKIYTQRSKKQKLSLAQQKADASDFCWQKTMSQNRYWAIIILVSGIGLCLAGTLFLTLDESLNLWEIIKAMSYLQFPWRYLSVAIIFIALLGGTVVFIPWPKIRGLFYLILIGFSLVQGKFFVGAIGAQKDASGYYYTDEALIRTTASDVIWDYMPNTFKLNSNEYLSNYGLKPVFSLVSNGDNNYLKVVSDQPTRKIFHSEFPTETLVTLNLADYPIWQLWIDNELAMANISQSEAGLVNILVPAGKHQLEVKLTNTLLRKLSNWLSLAGWLIIAILGVSSIWQLKQPSKQKSVKSVTMKTHHEAKK